METLADQIERVLLPRFELPRPFRLLFEWMESNGCVIVGKDGRRFGVLHPKHAAPVDGPRPGCAASFSAMDQRVLGGWFGDDKPEVLDRLRMCVKTGADGSTAGLWENDAGKVRIVHLGSGSGSMMACTLATDPVDFLRLLAIGYPEICWPESLAMTAKEAHEESGMDEPYQPNELFANWVESTFSVRVPERGTEIVRTISEVDNPNLDDPFAAWVQKHMA